MVIYMKLKNRIENHIVDDMTPKQVRYLQPIRPDQASGKLADIYLQARLLLLTAFAPYQVDENIINGFRKHSPSNAELLAATCWASYAAIKRTSQWLIPTQTFTGEQQ